MNLDHSEEWDARKADAPPLPANTCPLINQIQGGIKAVEKEVSRRATDEADVLNARMEEIDSAISGLSDVLEEVREANDRLRMSSHYWYVQAKQLQTDYEEAYPLWEQARHLPLFVMKVGAAIGWLKLWYARRKRQFLRAW